MSALQMAIVAAATVICVGLIAQSDMKAWVGLGIAIAIGFAIKWIAAPKTLPEGSAVG